MKYYRVSYYRTKCLIADKYIKCKEHEIEKKLEKLKLKTINDVEEVSEKEYIEAMEKRKLNIVNQQNRFVQ